jgi:hypothetical protein
VRKRFVDLALVVEFAAEVVAGLRVLVGALAGWRSLSSRPIFASSVPTMRAQTASAIARPSAPSSATIVLRFLRTVPVANAMQVTVSNSTAIRGWRPRLSGWWCPFRRT